MLARMSMWILKIFGWKIQTNFPDVDKYIIIAAPHTSNWDFVIGILAIKAIKLDIRWIGKHTIFRWPFGGFFRALGGTPVDRNQSLNFIQLVIDRFEQSEKLIIAMAPEGTRSKTDHWKTGFYHIARGAGVPITLGYLDFKNKQVGVDGAFYASDDIENDFKQLRHFYKDKTGKNPEQTSTIQANKK
jgi:1-acyl-sn-glycerol-3-phosphate acyltransferase